MYKYLTRQIRIAKLYKSGISGQELGRKYGVSHQRIYQILKKLKEVNLEEPDNLILDNLKKLIPIQHERLDYGSGGLALVREKVRVRDNHTCQKCLKVWIKGRRRFDVHHLDIKMESKRDIDYDRNNMDKMITLCHKCHLNLHTVREKIRNAVYKALNNKKKVLSPVSK